MDVGYLNDISGGVSPYTWRKVSHRRQGDVADSHIYCGNYWRCGRLSFRFSFAILSLLFRLLRANQEK